MKLVVAELENERLMDFMSQHDTGIQYALEHKDLAMLEDIFFDFFEEQKVGFDLDGVIDKLKENKEDMFDAIDNNIPVGDKICKLRISDLKDLFELYTEEQIYILKSFFRQSKL